MRALAESFAPATSRSSSSGNKSSRGTLLDSITIELG